MVIRFKHAPSRWGNDTPRLYSKPQPPPEILLKLLEERHLLHWIGEPMNLMKWKLTYLWLWQVVTSLVSQNFKYTIHTIIFSWWDVKNVKSSWCRSKKLEKKKRRLFIVKGWTFAHQPWPPRGPGLLFAQKIWQVVGILKRLTMLSKHLATWGKMDAEDPNSFHYPLVN